MQILSLPRLAPRSLAIAIAACAAILVFFMSARPMQAATCTFNGSVSTNFNTDANWDCGFTPGASSTAIIPTGTSTTMTSAATVSTLVINTNATLTSTGFDLTVYGSATNTGTLIAGANTTTIGFNADFVGGTFTPGTGTLAFSSSTALADSSLIRLPSSFTVNNLVIGSASAVVQLFTATTLTVNGTYLQNRDFQLTPGASSVTVTGASTISGGTFVLGAGGSSATFNATTTIGASGTLSSTGAGNAVTFNSDLVNAGTLSQTSDLGTVYTFKRAWTNTGTFTNNGGIVIANPNSDSASISGMNSASAAFFNFTASSPGKALKFKENEATYFSGSVNILGQQGNPIEIRSQVSGQQWLLNLSGSMSVNFANVRDSGCDAGTVTPSLGDRVFNQGNNGSCWGFIRRGRTQDPIEGGSGGGTPTTGGEPGDGGTPPSDGGDGGGDPTGGGGDGGGGGGSP